MTASAPESDSAAYVAALIMLYLELPETPLSASLQDHRQARRLHDRGIPLQLVESSLLLGSLRRLVRPPAQNRQFLAIAKRRRGIYVDIGS
jgi:hypothetical protein